MKTLVIATLLLASVAHAEIKKGDKCVELDAKTAAGKHFRLRDMQGKWVLFTFGASWCGPCKKELPAWDKLATKLAGKMLFVAVNIDSSFDDGKAFVDGLHLKHMLPVFLNDENAPALKAYDPDKMPSTFVVDPQGVVRLVHYGYDKGCEEALSTQLAALVK